MAIVTRAAKGSALTYAEVDGNFTTPVTIGSTSVALGDTTATLSGLTSVAVTGDPISALQLATKQYVDAVAEGLHIHQACACATPNTLASITGGSVTYDNGTAGVGATLTLGVALTTLDGYSLQNGDRILVKNEATQANNGIYTWATGGTVLTRATDFDTPTEIASGDFTFVTYGTLYSNTGWVQTTPMATVGTTSVTFVQFAGAGTYTAGTGLTLSGTQFSISNTGVSANTYGAAATVPVIAVNAQGQITSATDTSIAIAASQVTSGTLDTARLSGSYTGITEVGTLTGLTVSAQNATINTVSVGVGGYNDVSNLAFGYNAGASTAARGANVAIGALAQGDATYSGNDNVAIGADAMGYAISPSFSVAIGGGALRGATSGAENIAVGAKALDVLTTGSANTAIGARAGRPSAATAITTGNYNTCVGVQTGFTSSTQLDYATAIGAQATVSTSNTVVLGRTTDTTVIGYTGIQSGRTELLQVGSGGYFSGTVVANAVNLTSPLATNYGGTGLSSFTANSIFYASSTSEVGQSADLTFSGTQLKVNGTFARRAPVTYTSTSVTIAETDSYVILNTSGTTTVTLPAAGSWPGREIWLRSIQNRTIASASANVVPRTGGAAGTAIMTGDGAWVLLVSDGTAWQIMAGGL